MRGTAVCAQWQSVWVSMTRTGTEQTRASPGKMRTARFGLYRDREDNPLPNVFRLSPDRDAMDPGSSWKFFTATRVVDALWVTQRSLSGRALMSRISWRSLLQFGMRPSEIRRAKSNDCGRRWRKRCPSIEVLSPMTSRCALIFM